MSRHNQISHGTTKNSRGTTRYLTAQPNISRHNQKLSRHSQISHGKTKYLTAQPNISRHNQITNRKTKNFHQIFNSRQNQIPSRQNGISSLQNQNLLTAEVNFTAEVLCRPLACCMSVKAKMAEAGNLEDSDLERSV